MDQNERRIIDALFAKLGEAEARSGPRDAEAEGLIGQHVAAQPAAPYYMAQAIVVQQEALAAAQARIQELEHELAERPAGGFLSGLFGGGDAANRPAAAPPASAPSQPASWQDRRAGGGFLGGAMQTAMGVAGGVLVANALSGLLAPEEAAATPAPAPEDLAGDQDLPEAAEDDLGADFDFGGDEF